jgi:hypothetical protein
MGKPGKSVRFPQKSSKFPTCPLDHTSYDNIPTDNKSGEYETFYNPGRSRAFSTLHRATYGEM